MAQNITARRIQLRLTQAQLGEKLGVSRVTMNGYENGSTITVDKLQRLAELLYCSPADLLNPSWDFPPPHESYEEVR